MSRNDLAVGVRERRVCLWLSDAELISLRVRAAEAGFDTCADYLWGLGEKQAYDALGDEESFAWVSLFRVKKPEIQRLPETPEDWHAALSGIGHTVYLYGDPLHMEETTEYKAYTCKGCGFPWATHYPGECRPTAADHAPAHGGYPTPTALAPSQPTDSEAPEGGFLTWPDWSGAGS